MKNIDLNISSDYQIHHFDEFPILFSGINNTGNHIVGSFIEELENYNTSYFYSIVTKSDFNKFRQAKIPYLNLMNKASQIFIVTKDNNEEIIEAKNLNLKDIPKDWLPHPSVFCPNPEILEFA